MGESNMFTSKGAVYFIMYAFKVVFMRAFCILSKLDAKIRVNT